MEFLDQAIATGAQESARLAYQQIEFAKAGSLVMLYGAQSRVETLTFWQERQAVHSAAARRAMGIE